MLVTPLIRAFIFTESSTKVLGSDTRRQHRLSLPIFLCVHGALYVYSGVTHLVFQQFLPTTPTIVYSGHSMFAFTTYDHNSNVLASVRSQERDGHHVSRQ